MNGRLAYYWGEDAFGLERAAARLAAEMAADSEQPVELWRVGTGDEDGSGAASARQRTLERIEQRIATSPLFGGGTVVVVRQPAALLAEATARQRTLALLGQVGPGNGLCFLDLLAAGSKAPAANGLLRDAIASAGGSVAEFAVPTRDRMEGWIASRATELGVTLGAGAARQIAERVGAFVREGDIDRRRQSELANAELEKLALYRPSATVSAEAATLAERLLAAGTAIPLLVAQIHRRLRELVLVRDHLDAGRRPPELARALKLQPYRAQKLAEQARRWTADDLDAALAGLLELDLLSKGIAADGSARSLSDDRSELALLGWIGERVGVRGGSATRSRPDSVGA
jgi:DNA polymerase III delta subunit